MRSILLDSPCGISISAMSLYCLQFCLTLLVRLRELLSRDRSLNIQASFTKSILTVLHHFTTIFANDIYSWWHCIFHFFIVLLIVAFRISYFCSWRPYVINTLFLFMTHRFFSLVANEVYELIFSSILLQIINSMLAGSPLLIRQLISLHQVAFWKSFTYHRYHIGLMLSTYPTVIISLANSILALTCWICLRYTVLNSSGLCIFIAHRVLRHSAIA